MTYAEVKAIIEQTQGVKMVGELQTDYIRPDFKGSVVQNITIAVVFDSILSSDWDEDLNRAMEQMAGQIPECEVFKGYKTNPGLNDVRAIFPRIKTKENVGRVVRTTELFVDVGVTPSVIPEGEKSLLKDTDTQDLVRNIVVCFFPSEPVAGHIKKINGTYSVDSWIQFDQASQSVRKEVAPLQNAA